MCWGKCGISKPTIDSCSYCSNSSKYVWCTEYVRLLLIIVIGFPIKAKWSTMIGIVLITSGVRPPVQLNANVLESLIFSYNYGSTSFFCALPYVTFQKVRSGVCWSAHLPHLHGVRTQWWEVNVFQADSRVWWKLIASHTDGVFHTCCMCVQQSCMKMYKCGWYVL